MRYGIANKIGQPDFLSVQSIVAEVWDSGVREFDTAQAYGESERVLGKVLRSLGIAREAKVISKLHPAIDHQDSNALNLALQQTLARLGLPKLYGLMLHTEDLLDIWETGLKDTLDKFIEEGLVERIGVSVYSPQKAARALRTNGISLVQLPSNLLDRRFEKAGVFHEAKSFGKEIYVRSVFLQGLLLMSDSDLPASMRFANTVAKRLINFANETGFSLKQLALGYVRSAYPEQKVLLGCETLEQVRENLEIWSKETPRDIVDRVRREFQDIPEKILNPSLWV
jgi:aryl-alcohol dehydrogenase-like predicted oxidoreductase